jgi:hypothetical protein
MCAHHVEHLWERVHSHDLYTCMFDGVLLQHLYLGVCVAAMMQYPIASVIPMPLSHRLCYPHALCGGMEGQGMDARQCNMPSARHQPRTQRRRNCFGLASGVVLAGAHAFGEGQKHSSI